MEVKKVTIEKILETKVWVEKDMFGSNHIMIQHEDFGKPFTYVSINYDYGYTSNATRDWLTTQIIEQYFGIEREEIVWKDRPIEPKSAEEIVKQLESEIKFYKAIK